MPSQTRGESDEQRSDEGSTLRKNLGTDPIADGNQNDAKSDAQGQGYSFRVAEKGKPSAHQHVQQRRM
jgi:hypothetical protein